MTEADAPSIPAALTVWGVSDVHPASASPNVKRGRRGWTHSTPLTDNLSGTSAPMGCEPLAAKQLLVRLAL